MVKDRVCPEASAQGELRGVGPEWTRKIVKALMAGDATITAITDDSAWLERILGVDDK